MASTRNHEDRAKYREGIVAMLATLDQLSGSKDAGIGFWRDEARTMLARHLSKLGAVEARRTVEQRNIGTGAVTVDRMQLERDAAILACQAARKAVRGVRSEDREVGKWTAEIERERDYWRQRCEALKGVTADPTVEDTDPRVVAAFDGDDCGFWSDGDAPPIPLAA